MTRWWTEPYDAAKHHNSMHGVVDGKYQYNPDCTTGDRLISYSVVIVSVVGFEFLFLNKQQLEAALDHFQQKLHPSSRLEIGGADSWEAQRWFERLPPGLNREPKRQKIVSALSDALEGIRKDPDYIGIPIDVLTFESRPHGHRDAKPD